MKESRENRIKKLRKGNAWPSVLFLLLSLGLTAYGFFMFTETTLSYFVMDRVSVAHQSAQQIVYLLEENTDAAKQEEIMAYLSRSGGTAEAMFLVDEEDRRVCGYGEATYLTTPLSIVDLDEDRYALMIADEKSSNEVLSPNGNVDYRYMMTQVSDLVRVAFFKPGSNQKVPVHIEPYWLSMPLSNGQRLMVKNSLYFYESDFILTVYIGMLALIMLFLPVTFMFINMFINLFNQRRMTRLLYTDTLTAGNSWMHFEHYAGRMVETRGRRHYAVVEVSLMKYRNYCTCYGLKAGDELLAEIDKQLRASLNRQEICAHFAKSSFALLLKCTDDTDACVRRVENILRALPEKVGHSNMFFHAGICFVGPGCNKANCDNTPLTVEECYNRASAARASIEEEAQMAVAVFDCDMLEKHLWVQRVEEKMQHALDNEEFKVYIQPKYNPVSNELAGAEALVRWVSKEEGFVPPGRFIPIFEENGFITKLDDYMISHVARLQARWIAEGKRVVPISVNVSRAHFAKPDLAAHICRMVDQYNVPHHLLEIELTESAFFDDQAMLVSTVRQLKEAGFCVSMDDFGAGYSSLNSLKDLPLDVLKLDAGFFRGEDGAERGEIVVSQAIHLAKQLNMRIVAEGVEKQNQVDFLAAHDCDMIQGYYYAKPMPADEYETKLTTEAA